MFEFFALFGHPLAKRQFRRWRWRGSWRGPAKLLGAGALAALALAFARARGLAVPTWRVAPGTLAEARFWSAWASLFLAGALPVALAAATLGPWLRGDGFEQFAVASDDRSGMARASWLLLWLKSLLWMGAIQAGSALLALAALETRAGGAVALQQAILFAAAAPAMGLASARAARENFQRRDGWAAGWRALAWIFVLYPVGLGAAACVAVLASAVLLIPLWALAAQALSLLEGRHLLGLAVGASAWLVALAAATAAGRAETERNLDAAEAWSVPRGWLDA